VEDSHIS